MRSEEELPGAFTLRVPVGETQILEWATQLNDQDMDHPLSFAVIDQTTYSWSAELRHILSAPLVNVKLGYDWNPGNVSLFLEARNLTDVTYASSVVVNEVNRRFFEPGEPRAFYAGVS